MSAQAGWLPCQEMESRRWVGGGITDTPCRRPKVLTHQNHVYWAPNPDVWSDKCISSRALFLWKAYTGIKSHEIWWIIFVAKNKASSENSKKICISFYNFWHFELSMPIWNVRFVWHLWVFVLLCSWTSPSLLFPSEPCFSCSNQLTPRSCQTQNLSFWLVE